MKIIFLDFDGPIIPKHSHTASHSSGKGAQAWPPCIEQLNRITETSGAVIVVSSTWRLDGLMRTRERLRTWGVKADCIDVTPRLHRAKDDYREVERGHEIQHWMDNYDREPIESFVILDDDRDMAHLLPFLVHTPFQDGLTTELADKAIDILNGSTENKSEPVS